MNVNHMIEFHPLTLPLRFGYTSPASAKKAEVGFDSPLNRCDASRSFTAEPAASLSVPPVFGGSDGEPKGSPVRASGSRSVNPFESPPLFDSHGGGFSKPNRLEVTMTENTTGTPVAIATPALNITEGQITTTSQQVAEHFGKAHRDVVRAINNLDCSADFRLRNFAQSSFEATMPKGGTRRHKSFLLTRDGFAFLAMGFTGKNAAAWKEAYITAFNKMEQELLAHTTRPLNPAIDYDRISPAQAQDLKDLVHHIVDAKVQGFAETWARLHKKFRVNSYLELPATRFAQARDYLLAKLPAHHAQPEAVPDAERIKQAFALASEAAAQIQRAVFNTLIDGGDFKHGRVMAALSVDRNGQPTVPWAQAIKPDAMVVSLDDLPTRIENNDVSVTDLQLARIAMAVAAKQGQRATSRAQIRLCN